MSEHAGFETRLKAQALGLGFDLAGIATLGPVDTHPRFATWIAQHRHGSMEYLARGERLRSDTTLPEPGMRSALVVALDYGGKAPAGPVARYARGDDYHRVMWDRLEELLAWVRAERGADVRGRAYVDTGPILERDLARQAGLGWFGKNTMLIHPERGSFFFIGALFLDVALEPDAPFAEEHCGTCTRCLEACPTHALVAPGEMDARRCISYLTIEHRGPLDDRQAEMVGDHLYGCDICQDVCPWNVKFAHDVQEPAFASRDTRADAATIADDWLEMTEATYVERFRNSAMKRAKLDGLKRNARVVLQNLGRATGLLALCATLGSAQQASPRDTTTRDSTRVTIIAPMRIGATRSPRRVEDEPVRVETLDQEEVEEKLLMTPGDITMMLNETSGLRVQTTSQALGAANLRIQGLRGRYTQILVDGLPLHGAQTGSLGLLQIPPMDLAGVEVVKGVSSALYGGSALGGVINLVSRHADDGPARNVLVNRTSLGGTDVVGFVANRLSESWSATILVGTHHQRRMDRDADGWSDLSGYNRQVVRPRVFWANAAGHELMLTAGLTTESRAGGTDQGHVDPDGAPWPEASNTQRADVGLVGRWPVGNVAFSARASTAGQLHRHRFGPDIERDAHWTSFGEVAASGFAGRIAWVAGLALQDECYRNDSIATFDYHHTVPGAFAQATADVSSRLALSLSARGDAHNEYGTQFSPRLSALWKFNNAWTLRASGGGGFFAPTPFTEEVEVVGLRPLEPLGTLRAERATSGSLDLGGELGGVEIFASLFASRIHDAVATRAAADPTRIELVNVSGDVRTHGGELMLRIRPDPFHVAFTLTQVNSTEPDPATGVRREVPLTPRLTAGTLVAWEAEERGRVGIEIYHTGTQSIPDDPDRARSPAYTHIGVLIERWIGPMRVFVNAENLLDMRQTKTASLLLPTRGLGGRWTRDVWGPLDGRVFNVGVRF